MTVFFKSAIYIYTVSTTQRHGCMDLRRSTRAEVCAHMETRSSCYMHTEMRTGTAQTRWTLDTRLSSYKPDALSGLSGRTWHLLAPPWAPEKTGGSFLPTSPFGLKGPWTQMTFLPPHALQNPGVREPALHVADSSLVSGTPDGPQSTARSDPEHGGWGKPGPAEDPNPSAAQGAPE